MATGSCTYTQIHTLFAMHNSVVSLFLCSVTRDGEQRAEQGDSIIPAVFILHPTGLCTSHPSFPFLSISLQLSPIYTHLILSAFKNPTLPLILYFTITFFSLFHQGTLSTFSSPIFPLHSFRAFLSFFFLTILFPPSFFFCPFRLPEL